MLVVYNATKNWNNVSDIDLSGENAHIDENQTSSTTNGYTKITTDNGIVTIIGKPLSNITTIGNAKEPLKARLPKYSEVSSLCTNVTGGCPEWLVENLFYWNGKNNKYSINNGNGITNIFGYWLLSSFDTQHGIGRGSILGYLGNIEPMRTANDSSFGIRPVITVSINDLS